MNWKKVFATHEEPQQLSVGFYMPPRFIGVALPSTKAIDKWIAIRYKSFWTCALVFDVGPWCLDDDSYVFGNERPRAEKFKGTFCPLVLGNDRSRGIACNGAGIDLFPETASRLGIKLNDNVEVEWRFIEP